MASFLAPRIPAGPGSFVPPGPHRLTAATSPFDPSTSTALPESSDCGSSSGVGGMKNQELVSSDEGECSSAGVSEPVPFYAMPPPPRLPLYTHGPPTMPPLAGVAQPMYTHPPPPQGTNNDVFVHVQMGETLSIWVGNEVQHITGPATVRMVGEAGISPSALPLHVPPGHQIHQIVDEQGFLRHLILSPETNPHQRYQQGGITNGFPRVAGSPPLVPPVSRAFYTIDTPNRKWCQPPPQKTPPHISSPDIAPTIPSDEAEIIDMDSEEWDRVREMLTRIQSPQIVRITSDEADLSWQELDTSEAAAPGGPFPQIDASEFTYQIMLYENHQSPRFISSYRCEPTSGNKLRLCRLRPFTDYYVQLKASLEERGLHGEPSKPVHFKTQPGVPDSPAVPKILCRGCDYVTIGWQSPIDNGSSVLLYNVLMGREEEQQLTKVCEGREEKAKITGLTPSTAYHFRVVALNRIGCGPQSEPLHITTKSEGPPITPQPPSVVSVNSRSVKLAWNTAPDFCHTLEMNDVQLGTKVLVKERAVGSGAVVNDLQPGSELRFRLQTHSASGDSGKSDWTHVRVTGKLEKEKEREKDRVIVPSKPYILNCGKTKKMEIAWKVQGARDREFSYHVEGSAEPNTPSAGPRWRTLYRGFTSSLIVTEEQLIMFRVQTVNKKQITSEWSEVLVLTQQAEELNKPPTPCAPHLDVVNKSTVSARWSNVEGYKTPTSASLLYELGVVNEEVKVVYCGPETSFNVVNLKPQTNLKLRVRLVLVDCNNTRIEGEWSPPKEVTTTRDIPAIPSNVALNAEKKRLEWSSEEVGSKFRVCMWKYEKGEKKEEEEIVTTEKTFTMGELDYASHYQFTVSCMHEGGESPACEPIDVTTSAGCPLKPENVSVEANSTNELILKWEAPFACGAEIKQYHIRIESEVELIREASFLPSHSFECEHKIQDLSPSSLYHIHLTAENEIGLSPPSVISGRTRCPPPCAPRLECECESNQLKLRWIPSQQTPGTKYRIVRLSDSAIQTIVYDGESTSSRIRNLNENTEYRFQIRASDRQTGAGPWSPIYVFRTALSPPPGIRSAPTATTSGIYSQIEWANSFAKPNPRKLYYVLEVMETGTDKCEWHKVYEGSLPQHMLRLSNYSNSVQVRVRCVRPDPQGQPLISQPSPTVVIAKAEQPEERDDQEIETEPQMTYYQSVKKFIIDRSFASLAVIIFVICSFTMAVFMESLFDLAIPEPSPSPSVLHKAVPSRRKPEL